MKIILKVLIISLLSTISNVTYATKTDTKKVIEASTEVLVIGEDIKESYKINKKGVITFNDSFSLTIDYEAIKKIKENKNKKVKLTIYSYSQGARLKVLPEEIIYGEKYYLVIELFKLLVPKKGNIKSEETTDMIILKPIEFAEGDNLILVESIS